MSSLRPQAPHQSWPAFLGVAGVVLTVFLVLLGPEQTRTLAAPALVLFWIVHVMVPLVLLQLSQTLVSRWWPHPGSGTWTQIALGGVMGALLFTPIALAMDAVFGLVEADSSGAWMLVDEFLGMGPPVVLVWCALNASRVLRLPPLHKPVNALSESEPEIWDRVPDALGRDIVALSAELHYTRVTTTRGDALILYPFGRAVDDLANAAGMRVHRSHWIALRHVTGIERRGQRGIVHLHGGLSVPVSRAYRKALIEAAG